MSGRRRRIAIAAATVGAFLALVPLGRLERARAGDEAAAGIAATRALIGPGLLTVIPERYVELRSVTCLLYSLAGRANSVSLCFDSAGRLVEATDARAGEPKVWSVRSDPSLATILVAPEEFDRVLTFSINRERVRHATGWTLQTLRRCAARALNVERRIPKDIGRVTNPRRTRLVLAGRALEAAKICGDSANHSRLVRSAYGDAPSASLWDAVRSGASAERAIASELTSLAQGLEQTPPRDFNDRVAAYREAFSEFVARLRVLYEELDDAGAVYRLGPSA